MHDYEIKLRYKAECAVSYQTGLAEWLPAEQQLGRQVLMQGCGWNWLADYTGAR
ncbi:hypothetical protein [Methylomicrobium sp. Wu6]|uniref:hypothetical protein n=1 Tax=Methylomicrobium sp. Wu6 TaxID=3107928 RepID=UPI002DD663BA|nr:hypothetical protein [Methylomicrobium sp. Wu6]